MNGQFPTFTISNECPIELVYEHLKLFKPTILTGIASALKRLASIITNADQLEIKAISTNSESSTIAERLFISEKFGAPVFDEYSSEELSLIATQCRQKNYHIIEDNVRLDVLNPDLDGVGEIVATNLHNTFMPFIRYRQGDIIKISEDHKFCNCGNQFRCLQTFIGRTDQFLISQTVGKISPDLVMSLYDRTLIIADANIDEFQIVQKKLDVIYINVVPLDKSKDIDESLFSDFSLGLKDIFKDENLSVVMNKLNSMPPEKSHKRRIIKCEISTPTNQ